MSKYQPEIEISVKDLPSKGLFYPEHSRIKYRSYLFGEIKKLNTSKLKIDDVFKFILEGIETIGFEKMGLTVGDALFLGLHRKLSSLGNEQFKVPYQTPRNKEVRYHTFKSTDVEFNEIEAPELPITVEMQGMELDFYPITVKDYCELVTLKMHEDSVAILAKQVGNQDFMKVYEMFNNLKDIDDKAVLTDIERQLDHDVAPLKIKITEEVDGKQLSSNVLIDLQGAHTIIIPFRERSEPPRSRIRYGKGVKPESNDSRPDGLS